MKLLITGGTGYLGARIVRFRNWNRYMGKPVHKIVKTKPEFNLTFVDPAFTMKKLKDQCIMDEGKISFISAQKFEYDQTNIYIEQERHSHCRRIGNDHFFCAGGSASCAGCHLG